jgi:hypothetical protein
MTLAEMQRLFQRLATAGEADEAGAEALFCSSPELGAAERVRIYAEMYTARLIDALREDFPKLAGVLGDELFAGLGEAYARAHPSEHPDIGRFGRALAGYLHAHPGGQRSDLADLAALEWARCEVFSEAPAEPAGREVFAGLGPEDFGLARLELVPALRLLPLEHDVLPLWRALEHGAPLPEPRPAPSAAVVWRRGFEIFHAGVALDEARALEAALDGRPMGDVCSTFGDRPDAAEAAFAALASWVDEGWIAAVHHGAACAHCEG